MRRHATFVILLTCWALGIAAPPVACQAGEPASARSAANPSRSAKPYYRNSQHRARGAGHELNLYSEQAEDNLGGTLAREIESKVRFVSDPAVDEYLARICKRLALSSDVHLSPHIRVVLDPEMTAYSLPGHMYVNTGLIVGAQSEAELAGAIAHELGHLVAHHGARALTRWRLGLPLRTFMLKSEIEADRLAVNYMYDAGYDGSALPELLGRLLEDSDVSVKVRMQRIRKSVSSLPPPAQDIVKSSEFMDIKLRVLLLLQEKSRERNVAVCSVLKSVQNGC